MWRPVNDLTVAAYRATFGRMATWTTFTAMMRNTEIRLDLLETNAATAGWVVRRSCNVFQAFRAPRIVCTVCDLERDGEMVGIFPDVDAARQAILDALGIVEPTLLREAVPH